MYRFFIFHSSLVIALAILGNVGSPDLPKWQEDLDKVRYVLRDVFATNPLAIRCLAVLDLIVTQPGPPPAMPQPGPELWMPTDVNSPFLDFSAWPTHGADPLSFFGWPEQKPMP